MKNRKRVWVPLLVLLLVAAIRYSRPVTLPDLLKDQELQEINVLIRSLGDWAQEPETATVSVPLTSPEGAALLEQLQDLSFCRSLTDPLIKPLAQAVNASHGSVSYESGDWMFSLSLAGTDGDFAVLNFTVREWLCCSGTGGLLRLHRPGRRGRWQGPWGTALGSGSEI